MSESARDPSDVERRWRWALDEPGRRRRPARAQRVTFAALAARSTDLDPDRLIPFEAARTGDEQVLAAAAPRGQPERVIDLAPLAAMPSIDSIVASAIVSVRRSLPQIRELLLVGAGTKSLPDPETLRDLPGLETLWAGQGPYVRPLDVESLPADAMRELSVERALLRKAGAGAGPEALARFSGLRHLVIEGGYPRDSMAPLAGLTELVRLRASVPGGWTAMAASTRLEEVEAFRPRLKDLRRLRTWTRLRRLTISMGGLESLAGAEAFERLEALTLVDLRLDDLGPLHGLPALAEVRLVALGRVHDLEPLGTLPALRSVTIRGGHGPSETVHVDSLAPLALATSLEELVLRHALVDDRDLRPLADLPALRRVELFGDLERPAAALRIARPDVEVVLRSPTDAPPGFAAGPVTIHPPIGSQTRWWILEDATRLLDQPTNADAEQALRQELERTDRPLLGRLDFDTEAAALGVDAPSEADIRAVAAVIERLARSLGGRG